MNNNKILDCTSTITQLFKQYENNTYIIEKLIHHLNVILPKHLDSINEKHINRIERSEFLKL